MLKRPSPPDIETDVIIIGAGVTGINASTVLLENNINFWLLGSPYESQLAKAGELKYTSEIDGKIGLDFIEKEFEILKEKGIQHRSSLCTEIEKNGDRFLVKTKFQNFLTKGIVIAVGNKQKSLGFEGEADYFQKGISDCTVCDYPLYRELPVAVIGNHDYTIRAARFMKRHTSKVTLLWYNKDSVPKIDGITVFSNVDNVVATGDDEILRKIEFSHDQGKDTIEIRALFVEGEPVPSIGFLDGLGVATHENHIEVDDNYQTNLANIWAGGDVIGIEKKYDKAKDDGIKIGKIVSKRFQ